MASIKQLSDRKSENSQHTRTAGLFTLRRAIFP